MLISLIFACTAPEYDLSDDALAELDESQVHPSRVLVFDEDGSWEMVDEDDPIAAVQAYRSRGVYAEPDLRRSIGSLNGGSDPLSGFQWHLERIGVDSERAEYTGVGATDAKAIRAETMFCPEASNTTELPTPATAISISFRGVKRR